ncbi:hypothetical protein NM208_g1286 [Fusarium decemcellulare]|uniref:Uncharacterized protein n=1 Tax=Fusarium decemcellulare TaxID=57161 RepID=A0ACC1SWU4_9HYPO|nr:hypothetical protein NM208_g1286 [Fusarium decemcellulare]
MSAYKKIVLITGANQGVGYETAKNLVLSSPDYHVILGCRNILKGEEAAASLQELPDIKGTVLSTELDVTDDTSVDAAAKLVGSEYGRVDILVNNAGIISTANPPTLRRPALPETGSNCRVPTDTWIIKGLSGAANLSLIQSLITPG